MTARNFESQIYAKEKLDIARSRVDETLSYLRYWPGDQDSVEMFKTRYLFQAVLDRHRSLVKIGTYFWDEVQYYTDIIDVLFGWVTRDVNLYNDESLWRWLLAYSYLMGSINYLGSEQALCSVFFSIICFSHKETFYYANASFSGETAFRMYRQSFPVDREDSAWRTRPHAQFFPDMDTCRKEIYADLDYNGISIDPSLCDYSRKNETKFHDVSILTVTEFNGLTGSIEDLLLSRDKEYSLYYVVSSIVLAVLVAYFSALHILRCICIKCSHLQTSKRRPRDHNDVGVTWNSRDEFYDDEKLDELSLNHRMITYTPECHPISPTATHISPCNCHNHNSHNHNSITVKVATV